MIFQILHFFFVVVNSSLFSVFQIISRKIHLIFFCSIFCTKIQKCQKIKFSQNKIIGQKLDFRKLSLFFRLLGRSYGVLLTSRSCQNGTWTTLDQTYRHFQIPFRSCFMAFYQKSSTRSANFHLLCGS